VTDERAPWPPAGGQWSRWRGSRALEQRREAWTGEFLAEVSTRPDVAAMCEQARASLPLPGFGQCATITLGYFSS